VEYRLNSQLQSMAI